MKDLKIKVNSEAESKEAQELFFELGATGNMYLDQSVRYVCTFNGALTQYDFLPNIKFKRITLPELRDLVVLKRNDVGDATHTDGHYSFYVGKDKNYFFSSCDKAWRGTWKNVDILKPIEKPMKEYLRKNNDGEYILEVTDEIEAQEPHAKHWIEVPRGCDYLVSVFGVNSFIEKSMIHKIKSNKSFKSVLWQRDKEENLKEYLRKNSNGTYSYIGTVQPEHVSDFMIEIPEGATKLVSHDYVHLPIMFVKPCANGYSYCYPKKNWSDNILSDINGRDVFWSRHTHPEELPFIDDEPLQSLNDQYAEIEKVRQSAWQKQEGGSHYKNLKIQPMRYALENKLDYAQANVVKYVTRHKEKNGKEDLLKAIHNIELMIEFYYGGEE